MPDFADRWLDKKVSFSLLGVQVEGRVIEVMDSVCARLFIVAEFRDGSKQVKVGAPYQAFRRLEES